MPRDSWATPPYFYDYFNAKYNFQMDICASNNNHKHSIYLTEGDDAFRSIDKIESTAKYGYVWCNPPYSKVMPWVELAVENQKRNVGTVLLLKNDTSTQWFKRISETADKVIFIVGGRVQFVPPTGIGKSSNNFSSVVVVYHPNPELETTVELFDIQEIFDANK